MTVTGVRCEKRGLGGEIKKKQIDASWGLELLGFAGLS